MENEQALNVINDIVFGCFGYICGHLFSCAYIYKSRQYVLERMYHEQERSIDRRTFLDPDDPQKMLDEYPLASDSIMSDQNLISLRIHGVPDALTDDRVDNIKQDARGNLNRLETEFEGRPRK